MVQRRSSLANTGRRLRSRVEDPARPIAPPHGRRGGKFRLANRCGKGCAILRDRWSEGSQGGNRRSHQHHRHEQHHRNQHYQAPHQATSSPHAPHRSGCPHCSESCEESATSEKSSSRNCPKSLGGAYNVALRATETVLLARLVLRIAAKFGVGALLVPLFGQFLEDEFSEVQLRILERRSVRRVMSSSCSQPSPVKE